jgi:nucleoid-associated protein YgaU
MDAAMNREHKLALVLGFGLLLFVGILLSDHFSAVDRPASSMLVANEPTAPRTGPSSIQPVSAVREGVIANRQYSVVEDFDNIGRGAKGATPLEPGTPVAGGSSIRTYVIGKGDTLASIAQREYGSKALAQKVYEHNRAVIGKPNAMKIGTRIELPPIEVLTGQPKAEPVQPSLPEPASVVDAQQPTGRRYTVKPGDNLGSIAKSQLGSTKRWQDLLAANSKVLRDPKQLKPGMTLVIPE